jgi:hypothetical protein
MDCVWHLHLTYNDGESVCRNFIGHRERDIALEAEEDAAARQGRRITAHKFVACAQDACGRAAH